MNNELVYDVKLPKSAENFLNYLHSIKNRSEKTTKSYRSDLNSFFYYIKNHKQRGISDKVVKELKFKDLVNFLIYEEKAGHSASTRARKVAMLKSYYKYLYKKEKLVKENIAEELDSPKIATTKPITLNVNQANKLLSNISESDENYIRDKCIVTLFLHTGLRLSELCNIKIKDIKDEKIKILGKGIKERFIYLDEECVKLINDYLKDRQDNKANSEDKEYLFLSKLQNKINIRTVQKCIKKYLERAKLTDQKYSAHKLRGSFCTNAYRNGAGIRELQILMGHSSISTTQKYIDYDEESLRNAVKNIYE